MKYVGENALKKWTSLVKSDIKKKLDKNQGTANSGKILGVNATGEVAPTDTEVATLVDVPNGIVKGDGSTLSAAVAGTDYMAPVTGGSSGQVLTKTADGQEWADAAGGDVFWIHATLSGATVTADKTPSEVKEAMVAGKLCLLDIGFPYPTLVGGDVRNVSGIPQSIIFTAVKEKSKDSEAGTVYSVTCSFTVDAWQALTKTIIPRIPIPNSSNEGKFVKSIYDDGDEAYYARWQPIAPSDIGAIASGNITKQTLVASETTPTENYAINWYFQ